MRIISAIFTFLNFAILKLLPLSLDFEDGSCNQCCQAHQVVLPYCAGEFYLYHLPVHFSVGTTLVPIFLKKSQRLLDTSPYYVT